MMSRQQRRVIISGGGTGGHIFPAIAIANALKRTEDDIEILFIGALGRMEMERIPKAGYTIEGLPIAGIQRKLSVKNFSLPFKVISSLMKAGRLIKSFRPHAVVGVGGYASGPVLFTAARMKIPSLIQEQNSYAGITNRILGKRVKKICVAYENMEQFFPQEKIVITGNPVRKDISNLEAKHDEALKFFELTKDRRILLIIGGSLGAGTINESIRSSLQQLWDSGIQLIWQTGKSYYAVNSESSAPFSQRIKVHQFIDRMDLAYAAADAVISRAGALSIAELCMAKKAAILVPSPNVAEDHQTKNAMALVNKNAALLVKDHEAKNKLVDTALKLVNDDLLKKELRTNIGMLAKPGADDEIALEVLKLMNEG